MVHFTDWLPTLLAMAGVDVTADVALDGVDALSALRGDAVESAPRRFWQWNRYRPVAECNAAMRDGRWKLVRPAIDALLDPTPDDLRIDIQSKFNPDAFTSLTEGPLPEVPVFEALPSRLFDVVADPGEERDLAGVEVGRVRRMEAALDAWFADVEADRASIDDAPQ